MSRLFVVPAKSLARAKERLAHALSPVDRVRLALAMLEDVVTVAAREGPAWVVCSDEAAARVAREAGAVAVPDGAPEAGLNASLSHALASAEGQGFATAVVLASDLACLTSEDLGAIPDVPGIVIAPSADGSGTNALSLSPPRAIPAAFGPDSRRAHERLARGAGLPVATVERPGLSLDIDTVDDLRRARELGPGPATRALLDTLQL